MVIAEFNHLLVSNADFLKPFAFTLTHDRDEANDLLQETLCRALTNREKYNVGTNIKAWMYIIMRNVFISNYRRKIKENIIFDNSVNQVLLDQSYVSSASGAEANYIYKEIQSIISKLPEIFRVPFIMLFEGFKYQEISLILSEPLGTIKSRVHFARKLLKEKITRY